MPGVWIATTRICEMLIKNTQTLFVYPSRYYPTKKQRKIRRVNSSSLGATTPVGGCILQPSSGL